MSKRARRAAKPSPPASLQANLARGREQAAREVDRRRRSAKAMLAAATTTKGTLVMEGDSWFDYPAPDFLTTDVGEELEDLGYRVETVAHHGDTLESMAYDINQTRKLGRIFERLAGEGRKPRAVLLSGGGNDLAGTLFEVLLDHERSTLPPVNDTVLDGVIDLRLRWALLFLLGVVDGFAKQWFGRSIPVLIHGYDYAIPDGRGLWGGWSILPGPWLRPGFEKKGHLQLPVNQPRMNHIMDRFNAMLRAVAASNPLGAGLVTHVDLRGTLENGDYTKWWDNELHPTTRGFKAVAKRFSQAIEGLSP